MRKAEDVVFLWKALLVASKVFSLRGEYYIYRNNPHSIANKPLDSQIAFSERMLFANEIIKLLMQKDIIINEHIRRGLAKTISWCANSNLELLLKMNLEQKRSYYNEIVCNKKVVANVRLYMNRKQRWVFSGFGGEIMWLLRVWLIGLLARCKR